MHDGSRSGDESETVESGVRLAPLARLRQTASKVITWLAAPYVRTTRTSSDDPIPRSHRYPDSWHERGRVHEELRRTVDHQVAWLRDLDDKATRTLRFDALVLGVVVPVFSFAVRFGLVESVDAFYNLHVASGVVALVVSAALAGLTYSGSNLEVGVSSVDVRIARRNMLTEQEVHDALVESYSRWIRSNRQTLLVNSTLATVTVLLTVAAVVLLALGTVEAVTGGVSTPVRYGTYLVLGALVLGSQVL